MSIEFLVEMAWKSALISGGALAIAALLRSRSADERAAVLRTAVALILLLPLLAWLLPALPVVTSAAPEALQPFALPPGADAAAWPAGAEPAVRDDPTPLILLAWLGGALMVALRLLAGLWTLRVWTRAANEVDCPLWLEAFARAAAGRRVRLLVSDVPSPMGWGWLNPVILIDRDTIRHPEEAEAVLAHELAHVARRDWLVLILARIAVALFWFNPLLWLLERNMVNEAEEAADAEALAHVEPARYAQTLLSCAQQFPGVPATAIADTGLARRVKAVLDGRLRGRVSDPRRVRSAMALCVLLAAPVAALKPVAASADAPPAPPAAPAAPAAPPARAAPSAPRVPLLAQAGLALPAPPPVVAPPAPPAPPAALAALAPVAPAAPHPPAAGDHGHDEDCDEDDKAELHREIQEAVAEARVAGTVRRSASRIAAEAQAAARRGIAAGAAGMAHGADGMERGAHGMEAEADRLRSADYRREQIAKAARRGDTVTDRQLQDLIPRLRKGARELRRSAEKMRRNAAEMRRES
jgi:bla regulator protein blaR1